MASKKKAPAAPKKTAAKAPPPGDCPANVECRTFRPPSTKWRQEGGVVTKTLKGEPLTPTPNSYKRPCEPSKGKPLGLCRTEIVLAGEEKAAGMKSKAGPHVRLCVAAAQVGPVIPVRDHVHAKQIGDAFCSRVKAAVGREREAVAKEIAAAEGSPGLGAPPRARRKPAPRAQPLGEYGTLKTYRIPKGR